MYKINNGDLNTVLNRPVQGYCMWIKEYISVELGVIHHRYIEDLDASANQLD